MSALAVGAVVVCLARMVLGRSVWTRDETDLASLAVSMSSRAGAWLRPDYEPFRSSVARLGDGLVAPPTASALMALPALAGLRAPWAWPVLGATVFLAGLVALTRALTRARWPAVLGVTALALALAPRALADVITLEAEVPLAGLCALALAAALAPSAASHPRRQALLSGALLGAGFLCKLWLVAPVALGLLALWAARRDAPARTTLPLFVAAAALTSALHLALVASLDPSSLGRWLREVYLAPFGSGGIGATKWRGVAAHPEWRHGAWYYPLAIARELGAAAPLAIAGAYLLARRGSPAGRPRRAMVRMVFAGLALGLVGLSVPAIKEPLYVLTLVAVGLALAAWTLAVLSHRRGGSWALLAVCVAALATSAWARAPQGVTDPRCPELRLTGSRPLVDTPSANCEAARPGH